MMQRMSEKMSFSGRMANTMSRVAPRVAEWFSRRQAAANHRQPKGFPRLMDARSIPVEANSALTAVIRWRLTRSA
jgi:hypothetical protein